MDPKAIRAQVESLHKDGLRVMKELVSNEAHHDIRTDYQHWYTQSLRVFESLAPDRLAEFRGYYEIDPKRKHIGYGTYVIQDYFKNVVPAAYSDFNAKESAASCMWNQLAILESLVDRVEVVLANLESVMFADFQDAELDTARQLLKVNPRAAGALAGVVLEAHLQRIASGRRIVIKKKHPTIADLNEPLRQSGAYDIAEWRKVSYLADLRNLCSHKKDVDPTPGQVQELIDGVNWAVKTLS